MDTGVVLFSSRKRRAKTSSNQQQQMVGDAQQRKSAKYEGLTSPHDQHQLKNEDHEVTDNTFAGLGLNQWLLSVLDSLDIKQPTPVQTACIPHILRGRNVIGVAHTGSGKTAAFALPILQALAADRYGVFCLVMTPTRYGWEEYTLELALQIVEQFRAFGAGLQLRDSVVIGGTDMQLQARELGGRPHVVVATPGRLAGLLESNTDLAQGFARLRVVVLDEADRLLDDTFAPQLRTILGVLPAKRQTLLFSATMTQNLIKLQKAALKDAFVYEAYAGLTTASGLRQQYVFVPAKVKEAYLYHVLTRLEELSVRSAIIFAGTCRGCHLLGLVLEELDIPCAVLHSRQQQARRTAALQRFKGGAVPVLLCTDVGSRGLDIPTVDLVINFDLPMLARDYVHRAGRTARAGRGGWCLSFVSQYDVQRVHSIEELMGTTLQEWPTEEKEVLSNLTKVYAARRAAGLRMVDEEAGGKAFRASSWKKEKKGE